jgi:hypothetical protein
LVERGGKGKHRGGRGQDGAESTEKRDGYAVSYVQRLIRCGKPNCNKCAAKEGGHGPYWYQVYRTPGGKVVTKYVGKVRPE